MPKSSDPSGALPRLPVHEIQPTPTILRKWRFQLWSATVILVRHADIAAGGGSDPALSPAGVTRADLLAAMLRDAGLSAVYVTATQRSVQTGTPAAQMAGIATTQYAALDAAALAAAIRSGHSGSCVLVVAHSNTVDDIAAALGAPGVGELSEGQFDRMFVITRTWCGTRTVRMRYGAPTP